MGVCVSMKVDFYVYAREEDRERETVRVSECDSVCACVR